jgi:hypothetical protein
VPAPELSPPGFIIHTMHHLVLALMIALLPIRGWVAEVMATDMASSKAVQLQNATKMVAAHAVGAGVADHFGHASTDSPAPDSAGQGAQEGSPMTDAHGESCTVCQACHTVALFPLIPAMPSPMASPAVPRSPAARFASAIAAPGQKPPIS